MTDKTDKQVKDKPEQGKVPPDTLEVPGPEELAERIKATLHVRLHSIMAEAGRIAKDKKTNFGSAYRYVSHDAVAARIQPLLVKYRVLVIPRLVRREQAGDALAMDFDVDFISVDNPEDRIVLPIFSYGLDKSDKGPGKALSYAVKYALLKIFCMASGDDPEQDDLPREKIPVLAVPVRISVEDRDRVVAAVRATGIKPVDALAQISKWVNASVVTTADVPPAKLAEILKRLGEMAGQEGSANDPSSD